MGRVFLTVDKELELQELEDKLIQEIKERDKKEKLTGKDEKYIKDMLKIEEQSILKELKKEELRKEDDKKKRITKTINDFKESNGQLSDNEDKKILLNLTTGNFVLVNNDIMENIPSLDVLKHHLHFYFPFVPFEQIKREIPGAYVDFNGFGDKIKKDKDGVPTLNLFDIDKTMLGRRKIRENKDIQLNKDISFMQKYFHFNILFNNVYHKDNVEYVINWISTIINCPEKIRTTLLIKSPQRTGKNLLVKEFYNVLFGEDYVAGNIDNANAVQERNLIYKNKLFSVFNEVEFKPGSGAESKLKSIITDDTITIRDLNEPPVEYENKMACQFFTNNDTPFRIEGDDDRYSVFDTRSKGIEKLRVLLERDYNMTTSEFVLKLREEVNNLIMDIILYDYNPEIANKPVVNNDKQIMSERTETKEDTIKRLLITSNYTGLAESLIENYEMMCNLGQINPNEAFKTNLNNLYESMSNGIITSKDTSFIYEYYLADGKANSFASTTKIGKMFSSMIGLPVKRNGYKVRVLKNKFEGDKVEYNPDFDSEIDIDVKKTLNVLVKESTLKEEVKEVLTSSTNYMSREEFIESLEDKMKEGLVLNYDFDQEGFAYYHDKDDNGKEDTYITDELTKKDIENCKNIVVPFK